jgi:hypothetical protein
MNSLEELSALVGEWETEATHRMLPSTVVRGRSTFEWLEGEEFLIAWARMDHPDFPDSISIIGDSGVLRLHWFDSRGVARVFEMTPDGWFTRSAPDFSALSFEQRMRWTPGDDSHTVRSVSQIRDGGDNWEDDLLTTYRRA